jgi:catechol 2,3-dioxygenase-like lactoylglutathione lyase family enzyme
MLARVTRSVSPPGRGSGTGNSRISKGLPGSKNRAARLPSAMVTASLDAITYGRIIGRGWPPDQQEPGMTISAITAQLRTTDLDASIDFYVRKLGFELEFRYSDFYAGIGTGGQTIHLKRVDAPDPSIRYVAAGDHLHLYFTTDDVEAEAARLQRNGVTFHHPLADTPWGTREFSIVDDQGHVLYFGQPAGDPS